MKPKGFAWMKIHNPSRLVQISREGGTKSQETGRGSRWSKQEARKRAPEGGRARWKDKGAA